MAKFLFVFAAIIGLAITDHPEHGHHDHDSAAPTSAYGAPAAPASSYGAPADPAPSYIAPAAAAPSYAPPAAPAPSYTAPASEYGAPADAYGAPADAYGAPVDAYGAPADAYGAPAADAYGAPQYIAADPTQQYTEPTGYSDAYAAEADTGFDLSSISSYIDIPFFLAVFAAIIVAQLFSPLLGMLFGAKLDLTSSIVAPLTTAKINLVNAALSPFNLVLGNVGTCTPATGRSLDAGWSMSPDNVLSMLFKANEIYNDFSS